MYPDYFVSDLPGCSAGPPCRHARSFPAWPFLHGHLPPVGYAPVSSEGFTQPRSREVNANRDANDRRVVFGWAVVLHEVERLAGFGLECGYATVGKRVTDTNNSGVDCTLRKGRLDQEVVRRDQFTKRSIVRDSVHWDDGTDGIGVEIVRRGELAAGRRFALVQKSAKDELQTLKGIHQLPQIPGPVVQGMSRGLAHRSNGSGFCGGRLLASRNVCQRRHCQEPATRVRRTPCIAPVRSNPSLDAVLAAQEGEPGCGSPATLRRA